MVFQVAFVHFVLIDNEGADFPLWWFNIGAALAEISWWVRLLSWFISVILKLYFKAILCNARNLDVKQYGKGNTEELFANEWARPSARLAKYLVLKKENMERRVRNTGTFWKQDTRTNVYLRQSCSNGTLCISGSCCFRSWWLKWWLVNKWKQTPDATRPARPFLCRALAWETKVSSKLSIPLLASYL